MPPSIQDRFERSSRNNASLHSSLSIMTSDCSQTLSRYCDGDVAISDDRCMMHSATPFGPQVGSRVLHRVGTELRAPHNRKKVFQ